jgi:hypothetical protein
MRTRYDSIPSPARASNTSLGFRRGGGLLRTQLAVNAHLVIGLPVSSVVPVSSSTGSQQMRQIGSRGLEVTKVSGMLGMNWSPGANRQIAQEADAQGHGGGRMRDAMFKV